MFPIAITWRGNTFHRVLWRSVDWLRESQFTKVRFVRTWTKLHQISAFQRFPFVLTGTLKITIKIYDAFRRLSGAAERERFMKSFLQFNSVSMAIKHLLLQIQYFFCTFHFSCHRPRGLPVCCANVRRK